MLTVELGLDVLDGAVDQLAVQIDQGFEPSGWDGRAGRDTLTRLDQLFPAPKPVPPKPPPPPPPIPPPRGGSSPTPLIPDRGQMLFSEKNVDIPAALKPDAVYDLALFRELGNASRGVLVVTVIHNFKFLNGTSELDATKGATLTWTQGERSDFTSRAVLVCQFLIRCASSRTTTSGASNTLIDLSSLTTCS